MSQQLANVRRAAANAVPSVSTSTASPSQGAEERKALIPNLNAIDKTMLDLCVDSRLNKKESDEYFGIALQLTKFARGALESDSASFLEPCNFSTLQNAHNAGQFFLPLFVVQESNWVKTFPSFFNVCISRCRYPSVDSNDAKLVVPGTTIKAIHDLDILEVYFGAFINGLGVLYGRRSESKEDRDIRSNMSKMLWALLRTVRYILQFKMKNVRKTPVQFDRLVDELHGLILNRDSSIYSARAYKDRIAELHPADYFAALYHLMILHPEDVHKSALPKLDIILMGLLTQQVWFIKTKATTTTTTVSEGDEKKQDSIAQVASSTGAVQLEGICDHFLRMILERSTKDIPCSNYDDFTELSSLVQAVHERAGHKLEGALRYWSFIIQTLRLVVLQPNFIQLESFENLLSTISEQVWEMKGLLPFCFTIYPDSTRYLQDETMAEYLVSAIQADRKLTVFNTSMLGSKTECVQLLNILRKNEARIVELQQKMDVERKKMEEEETKMKDIAAEASDTNNNNASAEWSCAPIVSRYKESARSNEYKEMAQTVATRALRGNADDIKVIEALAAAAGSGVNTYTSKTVYLLAARLCNPESELYNHLVEHYGSQVNMNYVRSEYGRSYKGDLVRDLTKRVIRKDEMETDELHVKQMEEKKEAVNPIEYVKFERARAIATRNAQILSQKIEKEVQLECPICNEMRSQSSIVSLHGEVLHTMCQQCVNSLVDPICPYCRAKL
jgi:hypothetical protein